MSDEKTARVRRAHATAAVGTVTVVGVVTVKTLGEVAAEGGSIRVEGKSVSLRTVVSFGVGGGGISARSTLRLLPFGAGSSGGDRL